MSKFSDLIRNAAAALSQAADAYDGPAATPGVASLTGYPSVTATVDTLYAAAKSHGADTAAEQAYVATYNQMIATGKILPAAAGNSAHDAAYNAAQKVVTSLTGGDTSGPVVAVAARFADEAAKAFTPVSA